MSGCLTLPFRIALLALLVFGGFVAWSYRNEIRHQIHEWTADSATEALRRGTAQPGLAGGVRRKVDSLGGALADSIVLSPAELASVMVELAAGIVPRAVDSVEVRLGDDDIEVRALVDTRQVPLPLGPLRGIVNDREYVEAGGRLVFRRTGRAEWQVERVRVRGLPIPRELFGRVLERFSRDAGAGAIGLSIPRTVTGLRVGPLGVTLYGAGGGR